MPIPSLLSIATAVPPYDFYQKEIANKMIDIIQANEEKSERIRNMYANSAIDKRHSVIADFQCARKDWHFWGVDYPSSIPGMSARNNLYKLEAPKLAYEASYKAIEKWGGSPTDLTHIISVSCTGVMAPGIEFGLIQSLKLKDSIQRFGINFMGCFGAFKGLAIANAFAKENPTHRILVVFTELCSLHLQAQSDLETLTANALFSDGAAAAIVGSNPHSFEASMWSIENTYALGLQGSSNKMTWEASDQGFLMRLCPTVPVLIGRHIHRFTERLLDSYTNEADCDWAIHPGGKSILKAVEKALKLDKTQTEASWKTLADYGNMSSATFLFVLEELSRQERLRDWTAGVGFGPGLSMEGILLSKTRR